jgi:hypothetical protein
MEINKFLEQFVEGYLFCDIENMIKIELDEPQVYGACGYPIIMSTLSGMELLGGLLSEKTFDSYAGDNYFANYWDNCLCKYDTKYKIESIEKHIRKLIRHGLAHVSLTKPGIFITKNKPAIHWKFDQENKILSVDVNEFFKDFRGSYNEIVKANENNKIIMQARLIEMVSQYAKESNDFFNKIRKKNVPRLEKNLVSTISNASTMGSPAFTYSTPSSGVPFDNENWELKKKFE